MIFQRCKKLGWIQLFLFLSLSAWADERMNWKSNLGAIVGVSYTMGTLQNTDMGLPSRTMNALSVEALPGYRYQDWFFGLDFDYRWVGQFTSLSDAGGTNLKGNGYLLGVGAQYHIDSRFSIQAAFDFLGKYNFSRKTSGIEDDHLSGPLAFRVKGHYFHWNEVPLSFDVDFQYLTYKTLTVTNTDFSKTSSSWLAGVGVSWHFGSPHPVLEQNQKNN